LPLLFLFDMAKKGRGTLKRKKTKRRVSTERADDEVRLCPSRSHSFSFSFDKEREREREKSKTFNRLFFFFHQRAMFPPPNPAGGGSADPDDDDALMDEDAMLQAAIAASMEVREWMESHTSIVEAIARSIPALARARERWKKSTFLSFSPSFPPLSLPTHKHKYRRPLPSSKQPEEEDPRRCTQPAEERNRPRRPRSRSPRRRQEREREREQRRHLQLRRSRPRSPRR